MENNKKKFINKKPAMTLAEILVVVAIVAIIGGVFLAMPKKNVNQMDKAKYYVAYSTLFKLLEAQLINIGSLQLNFHEAEAGDNFGDTVERYLNIVNSCDWDNDANCDAPEAFNPAHKNAILTNGMYLDWGSNREDSEFLTAKLFPLNDRDAVSHDITKRAVYVDIDGLKEGRSTEGQDVHYFLLYNNNNEVRVQPILGTKVSGDYKVPDNTGSWINFRVFRIGNNGDTEVIRNDLDYVSAYGCYDNFNKADETTYCNHECDRTDSSKAKCFIEPIRPLK